MSRCKRRNNSVSDAKMKGSKVSSDESRRHPADRLRGVRNGAGLRWGIQGHLLDNTVPVGLRAVLPDLQRWPRLSVNHALQNMAGHWPSAVEDRRFLDMTVAEIDPKDAHVMVMAQERAVDILVHG